MLRSKWNEEELYTTSWQAKWRTTRIVRKNSQNNHWPNLLPGLPYRCGDDNSSTTASPPFSSLIFYRGPHTSFWMWLPKGSSTSNSIPFCTSFAGRHIPVKNACHLIIYSWSQTDTWETQIPSASNWHCLYTLTYSTIYRACQSHQH